MKLPHIKCVAHVGMDGCQGPTSRIIPQFITARQHAADIFCDGNVMRNVRLQQPRRGKNTKFTMSVQRRRGDEM